MRKQKTQLTELDPLEEQLRERACGRSLLGAGDPRKTAPAPTERGRPTAQAEEAVARAEFDQLKAERDQLVDRLARLQAEFENARKRAERERAGISRLCDGERGRAVFAGA